MFIPDKTKIQYVKPDSLNLGVIVRIKSHRARDNVKGLCSSYKGLKSLSLALYGPRCCAADGLASVSAEDAKKLKEHHPVYWLGSVSFPKRVPSDLGTTSFWPC